ncbi:MAG: outer membrane lipoprotein chaperone LolA [Desulfobacterales bacterium]|nr:outer membrane lipoprotein chaperone LolA [Desulfobacterales bacterium]
MKFKSVILIGCLILILSVSAVFGEQGLVAESLQSNVPAALLKEIIEKIETRYSASSFSAAFFQESTLKAMEITDSAAGKVYVKRPDRLRWEYESPERQIIITDGKTLWIFKPEDRQVMIGNAPSFFKDGKGAGFLSDIKQIRKNFNILLTAEKETSYILKLFPLNKTMDFSYLQLSISKATSDIIQINTYNTYGDETRIMLSDFQYNAKMEDSFFTFTPPENTDILKLDP